MFDYGFDPFKDHEDDETTENNIFENNQVNIVDFGFAKAFKNKSTGEHYDQVNVETFEGNIVYSSPYQLDFKSTSRRDDLISLFYVLIYLLQ